MLETKSHIINNRNSQARVPDVNVESSTYPQFRNQRKFAVYCRDTSIMMPVSVFGLQCSDRISKYSFLLTEEERVRSNEQDDMLFYTMPRFIQYVDENFSSQLTDWYGTVLKEHWSILDLCAAYDSHLPNLTFDQVTGLGMCKTELTANPALTDCFVKDLNKDFHIPYPDCSYDAVLCCMGLQYLKYPEKICTEILRILKPGGKVLISYTSHCFPEKTIVGWLERSLEERLEMVENLLKDAGFEDVESVVKTSHPNSPNVISDSVLECNLQSLSSDDFYPDNIIEMPVCDPFCANLATKPLNQSETHSLVEQKIDNRTKPTKKSRVMHYMGGRMYSCMLVMLCMIFLSIKTPSTLPSLTTKADKVPFKTYRKFMSA